MQKTTMEQRKSIAVESLKNVTAVHTRDHERVPDLVQIFNSMRVLSNGSLDSNFNALQSRLKQVQCYTLLSAIEEVTESILVDLSKRRFTSAEALARVAVEHAVNFLYIFGDKTSARSKSFLRQHFDEAYSRAKKWHAYGVSAKRPTVIAAAVYRMQYLKTSRDSVSHIGNAEVWPNARRRFTLVDLEDFYHDIFAPASDSIHALAEDAFNLLQVEACEEEDFREHMHRAMNAEKASFATYLGSHAVLFYGMVLTQLMDNRKDQASIDAIDQLVHQTAKIIHDINAASKSLSSDYEIADDSVV